MAFTSLAFINLEVFFRYLCEHAHYAPWIITSLLLLSGFCLPISEDILLICGGAIASTCLPEHYLQLYFWSFFGSYLGAMETYWIGRILGEKLYIMHGFKKILTPHRLNVIRSYLAKYGVFTFIIGRFCPGGVRNALFLSSGLTKMPFPLYLLRDGTACLISTSTLFTLGYTFGNNFHLLATYFHRYTFIVLIIIAIAIVLTVGYWFVLKRFWNGNHH